MTPLESLRDETEMLLELVAGYYARFVVLTEHQLAAVAVWTLHSYTYDTTDTTPYLIVTSAEKRSGKTRLLECLHSLVRAPLTAAALTEATLFRIVSEWKPTLLIDETDTIFRDNKAGPSERQEGLRAILNAGYRRGTKIPRMAPNGEPLLFDVFGPKVLAGIGHLPDTIEDRGLVIRLTRRSQEQEIERFRFRTGEQDGGLIRAEIERWKDMARIQLSGRQPEMPAELDDRAQDAYEGLIAVADLAGEDWGIRVREALCSLRNVEGNGRDSLGIRLLKDVGLVLGSLGGDRVPTVELLDWLYRDGEEPWADWWGDSDGKKAARRLALTLAEYDVRPEQWRLGSDRFRGYKVEELARVVALYGGDNTSTRDKPLNGAVLGDSELVTEGSECHELESADLQGSHECHGLFPHAVADFLFGSGNPVSQSPRPGTLEWFESTPWYEVKEWVDNETNE